MLLLQHFPCSWTVKYSNTTVLQQFFVHVTRSTLSVCYISCVGIFAILSNTLESVLECMYFNCCCVYTRAKSLLSNKNELMWIRQQIMGISLICLSGIFEDDFIEERRQGLEAFVNR